METIKYGKDAPFTDPVVRCDGCAKIIMTEWLIKNGQCGCGNRKIRNLQGMNGEELEQMKKWEIDPDFIALFEVVDEEGMGT